MHRTNVINDFGIGRVLSTTFKLVADDKRVIEVTGKYDKRTRTTYLLCGKRKEIRKGKKLLDRSQYPLSLVLPEWNIKLELDIDDDEK